MKFLDTMAKLLAGADRSDVGVEGGQESAPRPVEGGQGSVIENRPGTHDPILRQLRLCLNTLLNVDVAGHLRVAPEDALYLERIEISAIDDASREALAHFFLEFRAAARLDYVRRELGAERQRHIVLDHFTGVWEALPDAEQEAAPLQDAFEKMLSGASLGGAAPEFEVKAIGRWGEAQPLPEPVAPAPPPVVEAKPGPPEPPQVQPAVADIGGSVALGPVLRLRVWDAANPGGREVLVTRYPMIIGRKAGEGLALSGTFVSSTHGKLDWDGATLTVRDGPSRNGFWLNDLKLTATEACALRVGDILRCSAPDDRDTAQYPRLKVESVELPMLEGHTPVAPSLLDQTPVVQSVALPAEERQAPRVQALALLSIQDVRGTSQMEITHLPFAMGRRHDMEYVVPEGNAGVSREHLIIDEIDELGARVRHPAAAKHGGRWADDQKILPDEFLWYFDREILLATEYRHAPPVRLTLRRPA